MKSSGSKGSGLLPRRSFPLLVDRAWRLGQTLLNRLGGRLGYEGNSGADTVQENPTKPAKIQGICKFELDRFGSRWLEFRHRRDIVGAGAPCTGAAVAHRCAFIFSPNLSHISFSRLLLCLPFNPYS